MPPRGKTPGLKRGRHNKPYWIASQVRRDVMDFPDKCILLPPDADLETLSQLCHEYSARLDDWIAELKRASASDPLLRTRKDGTVRSICRIYQEHPLSPFHRVKHNTRRTYLKDLKLIETTVGARLVRNVTILDVQRWYEEWRKPMVGVDESGKKIVGRERIDRGARWRRHVPHGGLLQCGLAQLRLQAACRRA